MRPSRVFRRIRHVRSLLSRKGSERFLDMIEDPPEPNQSLKEAARMFRENHLRHVGFIGVLPPPALSKDLHERVLKGLFSIPGVASVEWSFGIYHVWVWDPRERPLGRDGIYKYHSFSIEDGRVRYVGSWFGRIGLAVGEVCGWV